MYVTKFGQQVGSSGDPFVPQSSERPQIRNLVCLLVERRAWYAMIYANYARYRIHQRELKHESSPLFSILCSDHRWFLLRTPTSTCERMFQSPKDHAPTGRWTWGVVSGFTLLHDDCLHPFSLRPDIQGASLGEIRPVRLTSTHLRVLQLCAFVSYHSIRFHSFPCILPIVLLSTLSLCNASLFNFRYQTNIQILTSFFESKEDLTLLAIVILPHT